jgi:hypothetical protein
MTHSEIYIYKYDSDIEGFVKYGMEFGNRSRIEKFSFIHTKRKTILKLTEKRVI